jgi:ABC-type multidrug transport system ATPase subunit
VGLNGAGKSTALSVLAGERTPSEGSVRILGKDPRKPAARRHLFLLSEEPLPPTHLTPIEAVRFHRELYGRPRFSESEVRALLRPAGLEPVAKKRIATFSRGMQRRLELACLSAADPEVWLLDEPQTGLDPSGLRFLRELCQDARRRSRGLVIASHALADIPALADEVVVLKQGRTVIAGTRDELLARVGARSFVVRGGDGTLDEEIRALARRLGAMVDGPEVPSGPIEEFLFREEQK